MKRRTIWSLSELSSELNTLTHCCLNISCWILKQVRKVRSIKGKWEVSVYKRFLPLSEHSQVNDIRIIFPRFPFLRILVDLYWLIGQTLSVFSAKKSSELKDTGMERFLVCTSIVEIVYPTLTHHNYWKGAHISYLTLPKKEKILTCCLTHILHLFKTLLLIAAVLVAW